MLRDGEDLLVSRLRLGHDRREDPRPGLLSHAAGGCWPRGRGGQTRPPGRLAPHAGLRPRRAEGGRGEALPRAGDDRRGPAGGVTAPRFGFFFWPYEPALVERMARLGESQGW